MSTVPAASANVFWAVNTNYTCSGVTYAAISNIDLKWGQKIHEEAVTGQMNPYLGTGVFHGEATIESLGSSDSRFDNAVAPVSGVAQTFGMTWREGDTEGTASGARTWTISGKFTEYTKKATKDQAVMYTLKMIMALPPTVVQS